MDRKYAKIEIGLAFDSNTRVALLVADSIACELQRRLPNILHRHAGRIPPGGVSMAAEG